MAQDTKRLEKDKHKARVISAVGDFMFGKSNKPKRPRSYKAEKERIEEGRLW